MCFDRYAKTKVPGIIILYHILKMISRVTLRFAIRLLAFSIAIVTVIILLNSSNRRFLDYSRSTNATSKMVVLVDIKTLPSECPQVPSAGDVNEISRPSGQREMHEICDCPRANRPLTITVNDDDDNDEERLAMSTCDAQASARGFNQTVVSYSFFGTIYSDYFQGIKRNAEYVARMYPGYVMRLYHELDVVGDNVTSALLCDIWCKNEHLDFCNVRNLPYDLCDLHEINGRLWRFLVLGDPLVERFLVRDIDSEIMQREVDAVQDWIHEGKTWHIMRDHPFHTNTHLAGMWGGTNWNLSLTTYLRNRFLQSSSSKYFQDQESLTTILWPLIQDDMVAHDSYTCKIFPGSKPWPTMRNATTQDFVGNKFPWHDVRQFSIDSECPLECRPKEHQDWKYC